MIFTVCKLKQLKCDIQIIKNDLVFLFLNGIDKVFENVNLVRLMWSINAFMMAMGRKRKKTMPNHYYFINRSVWTLLYRMWHFQRYGRIQWAIIIFCGLNTETENAHT